VDSVLRPQWVSAIVIVTTCWFKTLSTTLSEGSKLTCVHGCCCCVVVVVLFCV
jgi:hypothetical protein